MGAVSEIARLRHCHRLRFLPPQAGVSPAKLRKAYLSPAECRLRGRQPGVAPDNADAQGRLGRRCTRTGPRDASTLGSPRFKATPRTTGADHIDRDRAQLLPRISRRSYALDSVRPMLLDQSSLCCRPRGRPPLSASAPLAEGATKNSLHVSLSSRPDFSQFCAALVSPCACSLHVSAKNRCPYQPLLTVARWVGCCAAPEFSSGVQIGICPHAVAMQRDTPSGERRLVGGHMISLPY